MEKEVQNDPELLEHYGKFVTFTIAHLKSPNTILVNVQSVYLDMQWVKLPNNESIDAITRLVGYLDDPQEAPPRPMPPFANLWLEYEATHPNGVVRRQGILVQRTTLKDSIIAISPELEEKFREIPGVATVVDMLCWTHDREDFAWMFGAGAYALDNAGDFLYSGRFRLQYSTPTPETAELNKITIQLQQGLVLHSLSRMNCANTELRVINEGKSTPHQKPRPVPASVWHTIHISSIPKILTTGRNAMPQEPVPQRLHWIRGHYADYRRGRGLFGNPNLRKTFWIPEHTAGSRELGRVIPEYVID